MLTTVIVDTQNAYGVSGDALGVREKPTPPGVVEAFAAVGFQVVDVRIAIALPDVRDARQAAQDLAGQARPLDALSNELSGLDLPTPLQSSAWACKQHVALAKSLCAWTPTVSTIRELLAELNETALAIQAELEPAAEGLQAIAEGLADAASAAGDTVPSAWVASMRTSIEASRRLQVVRSAVDAASSFAYAGGANLDYLGSLPATASGASVTVLEGRFRPGRDGSTPGEKQVDTLCAVACVEATTGAIAGGAPHAVVVLSDDDDLTPAVEHAAELADGTNVRVIVAGSGTVGARHGSRPPARNRPRWLTLDASMWCQLAGFDPNEVHVQRNQLARLCLGNAGVFAVDGSAAETRYGLRAKLDRRDEGLVGQAALSVVSLSWGRTSERPVPGLVVGTRSGALRFVQVCRAMRAQGARLSVQNIPLDSGGTQITAALGVPGWWMAGDDLVVANVRVRGRNVYRIIGHDPGSPGVGGLATAQRAQVVAVSGNWATVSHQGGSWSIYVRSTIGVSVNDEVIVCPYERSGRKGPKGAYYPPRALLLSSPV